MLENLIKEIPNYIINYGGRFIGSIIILIVGNYIAKIITNIINSIADKEDIDSTLIKFLGKVIYVILLVMIIISALSNLGIKTNSFLAILGSAGLATALALQASLSNFASGFLIIVFRHFKVGDFVDISNGIVGVVNEISVLNTVLITPDNKVLTIPNSSITTNKVINYSKEKIRRIDFTFKFAGSDNLDKIKSTFLEIIELNEKILKDRENLIILSDITDSSMSIFIGFWVKTIDYWKINSNFIENAKFEFDKKNITILSIQKDISIYK